MSEFSITFVCLYYFFFGGFAYRFVLFLFLFLCLFIFILYWPKTVNFPVSQSLTFRSLTVGRVTWFFMVEPRLASEFEKILLSWPSSSLSPLLSSWKEDCTTTLSKICSSDSCGELGASFHLATEQLLTNQTSIELSLLVTTRASAAFAS